MKKVILPILAISVLMIMPFLIAAAAPPLNVPGGLGVDIWTLLGNALNWFFNIAFIIGAIFIVYAGWQYITAGGDDDKMKNGLNTLIRALIGVAIILLAKGLLTVISTFVTGTGYTF